jgi:fructokinase
MTDVTALGELLIDFIRDGDGTNGNPAYEANPGGAPCNVLAMLAKLGRSTAFIGKVGNDGFGRQLRDTIESAGISAEGLILDDSAPTTLAFVHTGPDGERDFSFYRENGADTRLTAEEVNTGLIENCRIFHFGTLSLTDEPGRSATKYALETAKAAKALISFDPNYRPPLWKSEEQAKSAAWFGIRNCDILKIADDELKWLTGVQDCDKAMEELKKQTEAKIIFVTLGKNGSTAYYRDRKVYAPAFLSQDTVDTTGAGDTFCACALSYILEHGTDDLTDGQMGELLRFANAAASVITTRKGALLSMPEKAEIEAVLAAKI